MDLQKPKTKHKGISHYKKIADKVFSEYIRYRDGRKLVNEQTGEEEWWCPCITCGNWKPMRQMHAGHFQSRRFMATRWDDFNVNSQCPSCNTFNAGEQYKYSKAIDLKFGNGVAEQLERLARQTKKFTITEIIKIIDDAKKEIAEYESR